jgi:Ser/Thr protein kinase RdoA (MazF antagonist)
VDETDTVLGGGNVNRVIRRGDTVLRPAGSWTPAVHALLEHLAAAGFEGAPRPLGTDDEEREVLTYVPGVAGGDDLADELWSDESLVAAAKLVRRFHDASVGFTPPKGAKWRRQAEAPAAGPSWCHNDLAPYNTIYRHGRPVAFIDWEMAAPAPFLWDIAHAVWRFVDITRNADAVDIPALAARTRLFCDAYGLVDRSSLLDTILARQHALHATIRDFAEAGDPAFAAMWGTEHSEGPLGDAEFLRRHRSEFARALA